MSRARAWMRHDAERGGCLTASCCRCRSSSCRRSSRCRLRGCMQGIAWPGRGGVGEKRCAARVARAAGQARARGSSPAHPWMRRAPVLACEHGSVDPSGHGRTATPQLTLVAILPVAVAIAVAVFPVVLAVAFLAIAWSGWIPGGQGRCRPRAGLASHAGGVAHSSAAACKRPAAMHAPQARPRCCTPLRPLPCPLPLSWRSLPWRRPGVQGSGGCGGQCVVSSPTGFHQASQLKVGPASGTSRAGAPASWRADALMRRTWYSRRAECWRCRSPYAQAHTHRRTRHPPCPLPCLSPSSSSSWSRPWLFPFFLPEGNQGRQRVCVQQCEQSGWAAALRRRRQQ